MLLVIWAMTSSKGMEYTATPFSAIILCRSGVLQVMQLALGWGRWVLERSSRVYSWPRALP